MQKYKSLLLGLLFSSLLIVQSCDKDSSSPVENTGNTISANSMLVELNYARQNPDKIILILDSMKQYYNGLKYQVPGKTTILTQEGLTAVNDAIEFLKSQSKVGALTLSTGLTKAAQDHINDCGPKGLVQHEGSDNSSPFDRMNRYGSWSGTAGENIAFGSETARDIVIQLIIDDGVDGRGHRTNLYRSQYNVVGLAFGTHTKYRTMAVQDFAGKYTEK